MELAVYNTSGKETGRKATLNDNIYGIAPNDHAIYLDVKLYNANQRQGTHKAKERNEISATTKKLKRQKGTGGARAGSMKSPVFVGGGRVFGPRPRNYSFSLNKKLKRLARISALAYKAQANVVMILEDLNFNAPKTAQMVELVKNLNLSEKKTLFVVPQSNKNVYLSSRNLTRNKVVVASDLNTYDILHAQNLVITEGALPIIESTLLKK
jgi:large subunit ribosomal protein L4